MHFAHFPVTANIYRWITHHLLYFFSKPEDQTKLISVELPAFPAVLCAMSGLPGKQITQGVPAMPPRAPDANNHKPDDTGESGKMVAGDV